MFGYIYKTTDKLNNFIYIGKKELAFFDESYYGSGLKIRSIVKGLVANGKSLSDRFDVCMIDTADSMEELNNKEKYWIEKLDATNPKVGYNISHGGDGGNIVQCLSEADQLKRSENISNKLKGHKHSEETKEKIRQRQLEAWRNTDLRERRKEIDVMKWSDPVVKANHQKAINEFFSSNRDRISKESQARQKARWQDPNYIAKQHATRKTKEYLSKMLGNKGSKGKKWVHKDDKRLMIDEKDLDKYLLEGWIRGKGSKK